MGMMRGSKPAHGHVFLAFHLAMVLEVFGVEDRQAMVDIVLEAAGERKVWCLLGLRPLLRSHLHLEGTRGRATAEGLPPFSFMRKVQAKHKTSSGRARRD